MICRTKRSGCDRIIASTRFRRRVAATRSFFFAAVLFVRAAAFGQPVDPEVGRILERALIDAENFRKQVQTLEYDATMRVQEWDGRGRWRGTAKATAIMRPGAARPMTFLSREIEGKVRLPEGKENKQEETEKDVTLQQFAAEHRISERYEFALTGSEEVAGERARLIQFKPRPNQPVKNTADRFLDTISGTAWVGDESHKLLKFEMRLLRPFQLFWIFAVLKDLSIQYELISRGEILGHAKLKVLFTLTTPIYSIRQLHDVDIDHFRRRDTTVAFWTRSETNR